MANNATPPQTHPRDHVCSSSGTGRRLRLAATCQSPGAGPGLTDDGKRQAEEAAQYIAEWRSALPALAAIYCSPLTRTRETAAIVGKALDIAPVEHQDLVDCDTGEWAGAAAQRPGQEAGVATVVNYPSGFVFPGVSR